MADLLFRAALLLVATASFAEVDAEDAYFKVGGTLVLRPDKVTAPITSIVWKYDKNLLAEWVKGSIPLTYYSKFQGRSVLNTTNGVLKISNADVSDRVVYSVEINNQVQSKVYQAVAIEDVPRPEVEVKPLACSSALPSCKLVCLGDVSKAGPVEYFWKEDDGEWEKSEINTKDIINNAETQRVKMFSCRMKNPVSEGESTPLKNVFHLDKGTEPQSSSLTGVIVGVVVVVPVICIALGVLCFKKKESINNYFEARRRQRVPSTENGTDKSKDSELGDVTTPQPASA